MFTKSISYWSFPGGLDGSKPVAEAFAEAKKAGFDAVEICLNLTGEVTATTTEKSAKDIARMASDAGVAISAVACALFFSISPTSNDPSIRKRAMAIAEKLIDIAAWVDAGAVLFIPGAVDVFFDPNAEVVEYKLAWERATEAVSKLLPRAKAAKIEIAIENVWNKFLVGPEEMREFIDQFNSPWVGSYFDVGNCMLNGYPEHWIRLLGKRIKRVHLKDFRRAVGTADGFCDLLSGDVNWPEVIRALKEVGYSGPLTAEMIPGYKHHPEVLIENTSRAMDAIMGA